MFFSSSLTVSIVNRRFSWYRTNWRKRKCTGRWSDHCQKCRWIHRRYPRTSDTSLCIGQSRTCQFDSRFDSCKCHQLFMIPVRFWTLFQIYATTIQSKKLLFKLCSWTNEFKSKSCVSFIFAANRSNKWTSCELQGSANHIIDLSKLPNKNTQWRRIHTHTPTYMTNLIFMDHQ